VAVLARSADDAHGAVLLDGEVAVGWGDVDESPLQLSPVLGIHDLQAAPPPAEAWAPELARL